jgi:hypothetical protein
MNNVRSIPLSLQFPLSESFESRIIEDLSPSLNSFFFNLLSYHLFYSLLVYACIHKL